MNLDTWLLRGGHLISDTSVAVTLSIHASEAVSLRLVSAESSIERGRTYESQIRRVCSDRVLGPDDPDSKKLQAASARAVGLLPFHGYRTDTSSLPIEPLRAHFEYDDIGEGTKRQIAQTMLAGDTWHTRLLLVDFDVLPSQANGYKIDAVTFHVRLRVETLSGTRLPDVNWTSQGIELVRDAS